MSEDATAVHTRGVESVRTGTILAHDAKAYARWRADVTRRSARNGGAKPGRDLAQLARDFGGGGQIDRSGEFEFRN